MRLPAALAALLIAANSWAWTNAVVCGGGVVAVAGGSCDTQTARTSCTTVDWNTAVSTIITAGQSFQVSASGTAYSIKYYLHDELLDPADSTTLTVRLDDDEDLSSEYMDSGTITVTEGDTHGAWYEIVLDGGDQTLSTGTTYYVMFGSPNDKQVRLGSYNNDANCETTGNMYETTDGDWVLTGHDLANEDLLLQVMICD